MDGEDDRVLAVMLADAAQLADLLPWGSLVLDHYAANCAHHVTVLVAELRRLRTLQPIEADAPLII